MEYMFVTSKIFKKSDSSPT